MTSPDLSQWSLSRIGDLGDHSALITGANSGLGLVVSRVLAESNCRVIMAGRSADRLEKAKLSIASTLPTARVETIVIDLASLDSVRSAADQLVSAGVPLSLLINNAGIMATPQHTTDDGFESQFATNHLGHFALTGSVYSLLEAVSGRVVAVSSIAAQKGQIHFDDIDHRVDYDPWAVYRQSKLANLMFGRELARRAADQGSAVTATIAHPGVSSTNLGQGLSEGSLFQKAQSVLFSLGGQSPERGALPLLAAAVGPVESGQFVGPDGFGEMRGSGVSRAEVPAAAQSVAAASRLWELSQNLTDVTFL